MKKLLVIILTTASFSFSYANTNEGKRNQQQFTAAEEDFILVCEETQSSCYVEKKDGCFFPEVIIIDQNDQTFAKGDQDNPVIKKLIRVSDYLTEVQGTKYFLMNNISPLFDTTQQIVSR